MASLELRNITKCYTDSTMAVNNVSLFVEDGSFVALVGPSGCGKSTILRLIAGLEQPTAGEIFIGGTPVSQVAPHNRDIAMVFQNYALYPHMTVFDNMAFALKMRRFKKPEIHGRVTEAAAILGLEHLLGKKPAQLSGGQLQRVAVGRAIVRKPALFLFDEPLSNLDAQLRMGMRGELIKLHKQLGTTMIYVTHDQTEAMSMGDRLTVLRNGQVQQSGSALEIYDSPANRFVAGFIGIPAMNFFPCAITEIAGDLFLVTANGSRWQVPETCAQKIRGMGEPLSMLSLGIRPEDIRQAAGPVSPDNETILDASVRYLEPLGNEVLATCMAGDVEFVARLPPATLMRPGERARFVVALERGKFFHPESGVALATKPAN